MRTSSALRISVPLLAAAVFLADVELPLGVAVWVLYFGPIALSKFAWEPLVPILTAAGCSVLLVVGYLASPAGSPGAATYAVYNRTFGFVTLWAAALIGRRFILSRRAVWREEWLSSGAASLATRMQGELSHAQLGDNILTFFVQYLNAQVGAIYLAAEDGTFRRFAAYAVDPESSGPGVVQPGEGLIGQVVREGRLLRLSDVPPKYLDVRSGLGGHRPAEIVIAPAQIDGKVHAVVELGFLKPIDETALESFARVSPSVAAAVRSVNYRLRQRELLEETQRQGEALQSQQEELRVQNEELEQQASVLTEAQVRLENQQAELEQTNAQLEEQTQALETQAEVLARSHSDARRANKYKSEFLANMSHELRTPLNSSLILSKLLADNRHGHLDQEEVKFAQTIYSAGNDLLTLINDILDLSKIEAGKVDVHPDNVLVAAMIEDLSRTFKPIAKDRGLTLTVVVDQAVPAMITTDPTRLQQVLRNLLSNALKFTENGSVTLSVRRASEWSVAFDVQDTGIGIASEQHEVIFEAFRQADGTTNRKYGGTGLGLSISRDLARLLGGDLTLESAPGRGSTFTFVLPIKYTSLASADKGREEASPPLHPTAAQAPSARPTPSRPPLPDDRERLAPGERSILVIEDDASFAKILQDLARELEYRAVIAQTAEEGLALAVRHRPSAIILDVGLPDRSGLSVLDALKHNPATRHIPVHMVSAADHTQAALEMGAAGYAVKPVAREQLVQTLRRLESKFTQKARRILVVEDDDIHRDSTCRLLAAADVEIAAVATAKEALALLEASTFDCMVLDLSLPDRSGFDLLEDMSQKEQYGFPPVIVYTGRSLSRDEEQTLRRFSQSIIIKGARSPERLLDEVTLFLHQVEDELPAERQRMLREARHREAVFEGRRVLIVEDDVRNIFALKSVLEPKGAKIEIARNGKEALAHLKNKPGVELVLMDVMMPEMDGIEATREIRKQPQYAKLPIIALTAKAMADDRENCLAAGANDYIAKPLDVDKLLSLARVWMPK